jgi:hypothetical protein
MPRSRTKCKTTKYMKINKSKWDSRNKPRTKLRNETKFYFLRNKTKRNFADFIVSRNKRNNFAVSLCFVFREIKKRMRNGNPSTSILQIVVMYFWITCCVTGPNDLSPDLDPYLQKVGILPYPDNLSTQIFAKKNSSNSSLKKSSLNLQVRDSQINPECVNYSAAVKDTVARNT